VIPVFVDLDGTLISHSTSSLELSSFVRTNGFGRTVLVIFRKRLFTRLNLKTWISSQPMYIDYSPQFNSDVVALVRDYERKGNPIILATASPRISAERVVAQCPVKFQELITSSHSKNIKGAKKLSEIQKSLKKYKSTDFIYVGDAIADLKIMKSASVSFFAGKKIIFLIGRYIIRIPGFQELRLKNISQKDMSS